MLIRNRFDPELKEIVGRKETIGFIEPSRSGYSFTVFPHHAWEEVHSVPTSQSCDVNNQGELL